MPIVHASYAPTFFFLNLQTLKFLSNIWIKHGLTFINKCQKPVCSSFCLLSPLTSGGEGVGERLPSKMGGSI